MKIAIVDDVCAETETAAELLRGFGSKNGIEFDIFCFGSGEEFLGIFESGSFDIIFMDIYMNGMTGVETARAVREKDSRCLLIFFTSSMEHMPDAFSCHAFEYIQKPVTEERILRVMSDALSVLPEKSLYAEFTCNRQTVRLLHSEITAVVSADHYLNVTDISGHVYKTRMRFSEFSEMLENDRRFLQINKGITVNMDFVVSFEKNTCILKNDLVLPVKVRNRLQIEERWYNYTFEQIRSGQRSGH
ncbi:MAG: LytTR family DNA-binding domain-containing protein [bacterium]|nr:LytTR family DNA-binding domain-containing protein [bacterium]